MTEISLAQSAGQEMKWGPLKEGTESRREGGRWIAPWNALAAHISPCTGLLSAFSNFKDRHVPFSQCGDHGLEGAVVSQQGEAVPGKGGLNEL